MSEWQNNRPIFDSLPEKGYKDNSVALALTHWVDADLSSKAVQLQNFYKELDPDTCQDSMLEYLAYLNGLSGNYWDNAWNTQVKRKLIKNSHSVLWNFRGTTKALKFVLDTHELTYDLWTDGVSNLSFTMPQKLASPKLRFFIRLPVSYARNGKQWREAQRTARNFAPAIVGYRVCHEYFRLSFSQLGEPMFKQGSFK